MSHMSHMPHMTHTTRTAMHPAPAAAPIAIAALGPGAQHLLAPLRAHLPAGVRLLPPGAALAERGCIPSALLILVAHAACGHDRQAIQATATQMPMGGWGVPTVCVTALQHGADSTSPALTHYSLQALHAQADAHVLLPGDAPLDLGTWLAQGVTDVAHALNADAAVGIDANDLERMLRQAGDTAWVNAQASGPQRVALVTQGLLAHPLLEGVQLQAAHQVAVWSTAAPQSLRLREVRDIVQALRPHQHPDASVLFSLVHDEGLGDALRVSAMFMGITRTAV